MRVRLVTFAGTIIVLLGAPLALASVGSGRVASQLPLVRLPLAGLTQVSAKSSKTHTCQAGSRRRRVSSERSALIGSSRQTAVVACEQPPRSQLLLPQTLSRAVASALAAIG